MPNLSPVLLAEDNPDDVRLLRRALQDNKALNPVQVVGNGEEAISTWPARDSSPIAPFIPSRCFFCWI